jgi:hypothetical protein
MVPLAKSTDGTPLVVHEVGWKLRRLVTPEAYRRDVAYAAEQALNVHEWTGEDRNGRPMTIAWVQTPNGRQLTAYEIQGA